jgi:hypothetical protein
MATEKKFVITADVEKNLLEMVLSGTVSVQMVNLQDAERESYSWKREKPTVIFDLADATVADLIVGCFSTSFLVRYQARARKCTSREIDTFLAKPVKISDLLSRAERRALTPDEMAEKTIVAVLAGELDPAMKAKLLAALMPNTTKTKIE